MPMFQKLKLFSNNDSKNPLRNAIEAFIVGCIVAIPIGMIIYALIGIVALICAIKGCPQQGWMR